jgi:hypothetical protein
LGLAERLTIARQRRIFTGLSPIFQPTTKVDLVK